ncbi:MAG: DUF2887 domain-containing protein [Microcystaceae cyanobacterium]
MAHSSNWKAYPVRNWLYRIDKETAVFTETFLYLGQYRPQKLWYCVALWSSQTLDKGIPLHYQRLYETGFLKIIYLDQLPNRMTLGIDLLRIIKAEVKNPLEIRAEILNLRQMAQ